MLSCQDHMEMGQEAKSYLQEEQEEDQEVALLRKSSGHPKSNVGLVDDGSSSTNSSSSSSNSELSKENEAENKESGVERIDEGRNGEIKVNLEFSNGGEAEKKESEVKRIGDGGNGEMKNGVKEENGSSHDHSVYLDKKEGNENNEGINGTEHNFVEQSVNEVENGGEKLDITNKYDNEGHTGSEIDQQLVMKEEKSPSLPLASTGKLPQVESTSNGSTVDGNADEIEEVDEEPTEYDVETVVKKQNTHDFYCPNCHSCITRTVMLRKRIKIRPRPRPGKPGRVPQPGSKVPSDTLRKPDDSPAVQPGTSSPAVQHDKDEDKKEAIQCLSCLRCFIPSGNGLKLLCCFGDSDPKYSMVGTQEPREPSKNWFSFLTGSATKPETGEATTSPSQGGPQSGDNTKKPDDPVDMPHVQGGSTSPMKPIQPSADLASKGDSTWNGASQSPNIGVHEIFPSHQGDIATKPVKPDLNVPQPVQGGSTPSVQPGEPQPVHGGGTPYVKPANPQPEGGCIPPVQPAELPAKPFSNGRATHIGTLPSPTGSHQLGSDVTSPVPEPPTRGEPHIALPVLTDILPSRGTQRNTYGWEILKSIVYGGLMECIASLGVVSSSVGADTATLNVLALGLANVFGGLLVIIHNLVDLKRRKYRGDADSSRLNEQEDRYEELLGRRENFPLHVVVALLSYLFFGFLSPVVYGFSFRKSDDKDMKLAAVAAAALLSITLLAIAKAHVGRSPKTFKTYFKTIAQYVLIGFTASGVSYVAGNLINKLIEKLGWFNSDPTLSMPFPEANSGWATY